MIRFLFYDDHLHQGGAVMMAIYWVGLMMVSRQIYRAMTTSLKLNVELEEARNLLEVRVAERTTALSKANTQLRKLTNAIGQSVEMVVITDLAGRIEFVNPSVEKKTGYAAVSLRGQAFQEIQKNGDSSALFDAILQTVRGGKAWHGELVNKTRSGLSYIVEMTMNPVYNDSGEMTHFVSIMRDVTERKALEKKLIQASRLSSIGTLVSGIAHELNTPLATILGFSREIRQEAGLSTDIKKYADWVEIRTRLHRPPAQSAIEKVQITIENDGPPIPANDLEKIFNPFYTTKATGEGTGLGLSLSYGIIKGHRGQIRVENRGRFWGALPHCASAY